MNVCKALVKKESAGEGRSISIRNYSVYFTITSPGYKCHPFQLFGCVLVLTIILTIIHSWRVFLSPSGVTLGSQASHSWESWQTLRTNVSQKQPTVLSFSFPLFADTECPPSTRHSLPLCPLLLSGLMFFAGWPWASQFILPLLLIPLALLQRSNTKHLGMKLCSVLSSYVNALTSVSFKLRMKGSPQGLHCFHTDIIFPFKLTVISTLL